MNLLYCGDSGVGLGVMMSVLSVVRETQEPVNVYILTAGLKAFEREFLALSEDYAESLRDMLANEKKLGNVYLFDLSENITREPPVANMSTRFTPLCMLRLYADMVDELPSRLLYLDSDVLCVGDPSELYSTDMSGCDIAGVPDRYGSLFFDGGIFSRSYLNSGVLLINLDFVKKSGCFAKARQLCAEKEMFMPDQTALNKLAAKKKLPRIFNEQKKEQKGTVFRHFTTTLHVFPYPHSRTVKPWQKEKMHSVLKNYRYDSLLTECERRMKGLTRK